MFKNLFSIIGPGLLVAATGLGAGDLIMGALGGYTIGLNILWACALGAILKWCLTDGLARWQFATNTTLLEGWITHLGRPFLVVFSIYLFIWSFMVCGSLINAIGASGASIYMPFESYEYSKIFWGVFHTVVAYLLVRHFKFSFFEKIMSLLIIVMAIGVIITAFMLKPDLLVVLNGLFIPKVNPDQIGWTLGLIGAVGGTLTVLSYGYWIKEKSWEGSEGLKNSRVDLIVAYVVTALFGMAMVVIGSELTGLDVDKSLLPQVIASKLGEYFGPVGEKLFLIGFWAAVFSSILGVWQGVPYIFSDLYCRVFKVETKNYQDCNAYKNYLLYIAFVPILGLFIKFESIQKSYAIMGAFFMPLLASTLLYMNNVILKKSEFKNSKTTNLLLIITMALFVYLGAKKVLNVLG